MLGVKHNCQQELLACYMSANAEGKANDSAGSATGSDGNDSVQRAVNSSSVVISERMTCGVAYKANSGAVGEHVSASMGTSESCNVTGHAEALGANDHVQDMAAAIRQNCTVFSLRQRAVCLRMHQLYTGKVKGQGWR